MRKISTRIKRILTSNLGLKIVSVLVACMMWIFVVNVDEIFVIFHCLHYNPRCKQRQGKSISDVHRRIWHRMHDVHIAARMSEVFLK